MGLRDDVGRALLAFSQPDEWRAGPAGLLDATVEPKDRRLLLAAVALQSGEAKQAFEQLAGVDGPVAAAMRLAATTLDRNWFPGGQGAILGDGDIATIPEAPAPPADDDLAAVVVLAYGHVAAMVRTWRSIASGFGRFGRADQLRPTLLTTVERLAALFAAGGVPSMEAYLTLVAADLARRARSGEEVALWEQAVTAYTAVGDAAGVAAAEVLRGDWFAAPTTSPEVLGLDPEAVVEPPPASEADAEACYGRAAATFAAEHNERGLAAVTLRRAFLARCRGDAAAWAAGATEAEALASAAGDSSSAQLAAVHVALAEVDTGADRHPAAVARDVGAWTRGRGSTSYGRGLVRLVVAQATVWRQAGEFVRAHGALGLAEHLGQAVGATLEPAVIGQELAELHRSSFPLAAVVLALGDLDHDLASTPRPSADIVAWATLANQAMTVYAAAVDRRDADAIAAAATRLADVSSRAPTSAVGLAELGTMTGEAMRAAVLDAIDSSQAAADVLVPLYRGVDARLAGRTDDATRLFDDAERAVRRQGPAGRLLLVIVLGTADRDAEALPIADELVAAGELSGSLAVELYLQLGRPARAAELAARHPELATPAPDDWEALAQQAALADGTGDPEGALRSSARAIDAFERRLTRVGRDVLTSAATDDPAAAGMYLTAVRAHLAGRPGVSEAIAAARAFAVSDRVRAVALADLLALGSTSGPARVALRAWRRAGSHWAAAFEELSDQLGTPPSGPDAAAARARLATTEDDLDDAEAELARVAPGVLVAQRTPPPPCDVAAVAGSLPPSTVLVQYHCYGDDLIVWALDRDGLAVHRATVDWRAVAGETRRFHAHASGHGTAFDPGPLADLLLGPIAQDLALHEHVVIVPHGPLTLLPFHLLPFDGDVLGGRRVVSSLPAASLAPARQNTQSVRLDRGALVVGNPAYDPTRGLRALPGATTEAVTVARLLAETSPLIGAAATEVNVTAAAPTHPILHLATHGLLYERSPNRSALALAGRDELSVGDLMGLDLDADLVVLSACDTGRGRATIGGDVVGLVRAVLAAGARHVVVSLWPVDDEAGCLLMTRFYERLVGGSTVASALTDAASSVRTLDAAERAAAYEALRAAAGTDAAAGRRDMGGSARSTSTPNSSFWAPFIHIGL